MAATITPEQVFREFETGVAFKNSLGRNGMYEQDRINERFYIGDQWHGANCGDNRPLVRHNVIRRIGEYKIAVICSSPVSVRFSAEGIPSTPGLREQVRVYRAETAAGREITAPLSPEAEAQAAAGALTDYFTTTARRLKLDDLKGSVLRSAYITGTGVLYTYWDDSIRTGLYADVSRQKPICGDIVSEALEIENVYFGDPTVEDVQQQPYIIIAQRKRADELQRLAKRYGASGWKDICPDPDSPDPGCATLLTRFWKDWAADGSYTIRAVQMCRGVTVRPEWELGIRLYPLTVFRWEPHRGHAYGDSEIPWLIPNQIAINRTVSANVWATMAAGMPIMTVNGDVVTQPVTNDPGQIVPVYGTPEEVRDAIRYVDPPAFPDQFDRNAESLITNTMTQAGANSTLLGDVQPTNTSAIIAVREASLMPLQVMQNRFYSFLEDTARVWSEFWLSMYGSRALKIEQDTGTWYMPFEAERYRDLLLNIRADVGSGNPYSETRTVETLDNLFARGVINARQYLSRLPAGIVPDADALLQELDSPRS